MLNHAHELFELKKHINAIHCSNNLSLVQRKLFNALLFNAYDDLPTQARFFIKAKMLCHLIGYNSNDYASLKKALMGLMTVAVEWNVVEYSGTKSKDKWRASAILSSAKLEDGICTYEYSSVMRELLYQPDIYGRINIDVLARFKSSYGLALYENAIRYRDLPMTPWFPLDVFRKLMGVVGDKYIVFKDFKKRVLDVAVKEVNELATIAISPELKRSQQKVVSIRFNIKAKQFISAKEELPPSDETLITVLNADFNLSLTRIKPLLQQYDASYIWEKVKLIKASESYKTNKIRVLSSYLLDALRRDYQPAEDKLPRRSNTDVHIQAARREEACQRQYMQYWQAGVTAYLAALSADERSSLDDEFTRYLESYNTTIKRWHAEHGLSHPGVNALFFEYIKTQRSETLQLLDYATFAQTKFEKETFTG